MGHLQVEYIHWLIPKEHCNNSRNRIQPSRIQICTIGVIILASFHFILSFYFNRHVFPYGKDSSHQVRDFSFDHCIKTGVEPIQPPVLNLYGSVLN
jgi:hypothetical protein